MPWKKCLSIVYKKKSIKVFLYKHYRAEKSHSYVYVSDYRGIVPLAHTRIYWESDLFITNTMSVNQFEKIWKYLHFNYNTTRASASKKIGPKHCKKSQAIKKRETLSLDEQICSIQEMQHFRQYVPKKPHKLLILCDESVVVYDFEITTTPHALAKELYIPYII